MSRKLTTAVAVVLLVCFLFVFAFSFLSPYIAHADTTQQKIDQKANEKKDIQNKINKKENEKKGILEKKEALELQIDAVQEEINVIQKDIDKYNGQIAQKEAELAENERKSKAQYETMKTRLRVMYEDNSTSYITMLFSGENINDVLSYIEIIKQLLGYDNDMYNNYLDTMKEIEEIKSGLEADKAVVVANQDVYKSKKAVLDGQKADLQAIENSINTDINAYKAAYEEAERIEAALKKQLAAELSKTNGNSKYNGGKFLWPSPGYYTITSEYGYRIHPTLKVYKLHTGFDIAVPSGSKIIASAAGKVVKAQYNTAYGYYVVVDHGGGYSTLYAHNSRLLVSAGQQVTAGQQLAVSGSTGYSTGPHLHYEVMVNGSPVNPREYL